MTNRIGITLIGVSFLWGAYLASLDPELISWTPFAMAMIIGIIGVVIAHSGRKKDATAEHKIEEDMSVIRQSLANIISKVSGLAEEKETINTYDFSGRIDELLLDDLNAFVAARKTINHANGIKVYAAVMTHYAAGERYLNRVWSASVDGYIDEVHAYIDKARDQFIEANDKLNIKID